MTRNILHDRGKLAHLAGKKPGDVQRGSRYGVVEGAVGKNGEGKEFGRLMRVLGSHTLARKLASRAMPIARARQRALKCVLANKAQNH